MWCLLSRWCLSFNSTKIEKEKRELAKQYGMVRNEVAGGEIAEELEKERRMFQLQMCEVSNSQPTTYDMNIRLYI